MTTTVLEANTVSLTSNAANVSGAANSASVSFATLYDNPVVVPYSLTTNGGDDYDVRATNVASNGCDIFGQEPDEGAHANETAAYVVAESGVHETPEGHRIEAGLHSTKTTHEDGDVFNGNHVEFENDWGQAPVVLASVNTYNSETWSVPGIENVTANGFDIAQDQGGYINGDGISNEDSATAIEQIAWIALPPVGATTLDGVTAEIGTTGSSTTSHTYSASFGSAPAAVVEAQARDSTETTWVRGSSAPTDSSHNWYYGSSNAQPSGYLFIPSGTTVTGYDAASFQSGTFDYTNHSSHNYFNEVGGFITDANLQGTIDGFKRTVAYFDASANDGYEDIFTGQFTTSDFRGSGSGNYLYLAFAAKWNEIPVWGVGQDWIRKPSPDSSKYQLYVLRSDGQNSRNEYFRLYYGNTNDTATAYVADPFVWRGWETGTPSDAGLFGDTSNRTVWPSDRAGASRGYDGLNSNGNPKNNGGHYAGTIENRGTAHTPDATDSAVATIESSLVSTGATATGQASTAGVGLTSTETTTTTVAGQQSLASTTSLGVDPATATSDVSKVTGSLTSPKTASPTTDTTSSASTDSATTTTATAPATVTYDGPGTVSATYNSDRSITVSWEKTNAEADVWHVQMSRDGGSWTDPVTGATTDASNTSLTVTANSDNNYSEVVGADSSFRFRVRAEGSDTPSSWNYSGLVYTTPVPPKSPSINRPDGDTVELTFTHWTDLGADGQVDIEYRVDTGSGYGGWGNFETIPAQSKGTTETRTYTVGNELQADVRYQFRLAHYIYHDGDNDGSNELYESRYVYADYGNANNVYFTDDFEDGDLAEWDSFSDGDGEEDVMEAADIDDEEDTGISGPESGSHFLLLQNDGQVTKKLGDLSAESNVLVSCAMAAGSMDLNGEEVTIDWYDGSSWNTLVRFSDEMNEQGWVEVGQTVPSSWLSTDNRIRLDGYGGPGDYLAVDRLVVSDVLHEYTTPDTPTDLLLDPSFHEISATWTDEAAFVTADDQYVKSKHEINYKKASASDWTKRHNVGTSYTITDLADDTTYDVHVHAGIYQHRHGNHDNLFVPAGPTTQTTTLNEETSQVTATASSAATTIAGGQTATTAASSVGPATATPDDGTAATTADAVGSATVSGSTPVLAGADTTTTSPATEATVASQPHPADIEIESVAGVTTSATDSKRGRSSLRAESSPTVAETTARAAVGSATTDSAGLAANGKMQPETAGATTAVTPSLITTTTPASPDSGSAATTTSAGGALVDSGTATATASPATSAFSASAPTTATADGQSARSTTATVDSPAPTQSSADGLVGAANTTTTVGSITSAATQTFGLDYTTATAEIVVGDGIYAVSTTPTIATTVTATGTVVTATATTVGGGKATTSGGGKTSVTTTPLQSTVDPVVYTTENPTEVATATQSASVTATADTDPAITTGSSAPTDADGRTDTTALVQAEAVTTTPVDGVTATRTAVSARKPTVASVVATSGGVATSHGGSHTDVATTVRQSRADLTVTSSTPTAKTTLASGNGFTRTTDSAVVGAGVLPDEGAGRTTTTAGSETTAVTSDPVTATATTKTTDQSVSQTATTDTAGAGTSQSVGGQTTAVDTAQSIGRPVTSVTTAEVVSQSITAEFGFATTTATATIDKHDGVIANPQAGAGFTTTTADAETSQIAGLGEQRLDPLTASTSVSETVDAEVIVPTDSVEAITLTTSDGEQVPAVVSAKIVDPVAETVAIAAVAAADADSHDGFFTSMVMTKQGDFDTNSEFDYDTDSAITVSQSGVEMDNDTDSTLEPTDANTHYRDDGNG